MPENASSYLRKIAIGGFVIKFDMPQLRERKRGIHVEYALVGFIPVDELMKAEHAEGKSSLLQKNLGYYFTSLALKEAGFFCR